MIGKAMVAGVVVGLGLGLWPTHGRQDTTITPPLRPIQMPTYTPPPPSIDQPDLNGEVPVNTPAPEALPASDWCKQNPGITHCGMLFT